MTEKRRLRVSKLHRSLGALLFAAVLAGCATPPAPDAAAAAATSQVDRIRNAGVIRVGVISVAPWAMTDRSGEWIGLDVDIGRKLAEDLGVRVEFVRMSWQGAADDAAEGHVDVAAGLWAGPRRALVVNFSDPYAVTAVTLVASRAKTAGFTRIADFDQATVRLGVRRGGLAESVARQQFKQATLVPFDSDGDQLGALIAGDLTALVSRTPSPEFIALVDPQNFVLPLTEPLARRSEVLAIARGDADFLNYLNAWIRYHEETGWLPQRRAHWLGSLAWHAQR